MIAIALTGTGKSLIYIIPAIIIALEEEMKFPIMNGEGPFALLLMPSVSQGSPPHLPSQHELAIQTFETVTAFCESLHENGLPLIKAALCMGGTDVRQQYDELRKYY
jgi:ATP-dependent RNA helicase DDX41